MSCGETNPSLGHLLAFLEWVKHMTNNSLKLIQFMNSYCLLFFLYSAADPETRAALFCNQTTTLKVLTYNRFYDLSEMGWGWIYEGKFLYIEYEKLAFSIPLAIFSYSHIPCVISFLSSFLLSLLFLVGQFHYLLSFLLQQALPLGLTFTLESYE